MRLFLVVFLFAAGTCSEDVVLEFFGKVGEFDGLPLNLHCEKRGGYIRIGGITVDNMPVDEKVQRHATKKCNQQCQKNLKDVIDGKTDSKTTGCVLTLPQLKANETETIRVVYDCYDSKPASSPPWGREKKKNKKTAKLKTASTAVANARVRLTCKRSYEMLFINDVMLNDVIADSSVHGALEPGVMTQQCGSMWKQEQESSPSSSKGPTCDIVNWKEYDGKLTINYYCIAPGTEPAKVERKSPASPAKSKATSKPKGSKSKKKGSKSKSKK